MVNYNYSFEARDDLKEIYKYTLINFGIKQAKDYMAKITGNLILVANKTLQGRNADILKHGLRKIESGSHVIFYLQKANYIFVVRVLHQSMDVKQHI